MSKRKQSKAEVKAETKHEREMTAIRISKVLGKGQFGKLAVGHKSYDSHTLLPEVNYKD